jgi:glycogen debranching enzyme
MKFKIDLQGLLDDLDSAVFYVPDREMGKIVRRIVEKEMTDAKLRTDRSGRPKTGFDMQLPPNGKEHSHRQLIAKAVAKGMDDDYHGMRNLSHYNPKQLGNSVRTHADAAGQYTPERMLTAIE